MVSHSHLLKIVKQLPEDYQPWGKDQRETDTSFGPDCSWGCKFFHAVEGQQGMDWGVCANPGSHRVGLLTFEHQGCRKFEQSEEEDV